MLAFFLTMKKNIATDKHNVWGTRQKGFVGILFRDLGFNAVPIWLTLRQL